MSVSETNDPVFIHGNLMRHVSVMAFMASIGLMAMFAVDFVDMIFISMLGNASLAAAVGFAGTILFFTNSINIGLSIAAGSLVARALGAKKTTEAREYASSVATFGLITGIIVPMITLPSLPWLLALLGATGEIADLAQSYLWIVLPTMPVVSVAIIGMAVLRAHGDAKLSMMSTLVGGLVNAALDPLLIFTAGLELDGAAYASVVARFVMLIVAVVPAVRKYDGLALPSVAMLKRDFKAVTAIASPAVLANIATPVGSAVVTREIAKFGTEAVAGMAVIGRLTPVAFAVVFALSGAIGPVIGQNFGAGLLTRVRGAFVSGLIFVGIYVVIASAVLFAARDLVAATFEAQGVALDLIYIFCGPLALLFFFNGVIFVANASFNNLGKPSYSTWVNWGRNTLGTWPLAIAGGAIYGAPGVLIGQAAGGIIFAGVAVMLAYRVMNAPQPVAPKTDPFRRHQRFQMLFGRRNW